MEMFNYVKRNCSEDNINGIIGLEDYECTKCNINSIPINYKNSFVCVEEHFFD